MENCWNRPTYTQWYNGTMVVTDYFSRYIELVHLTETTSDALINRLKGIFARWGVPEKVISDNGPQYSSRAFSEFANKYGFEHVTSSPRYPQSNGLAERSVRTVKEMLGQEDPILALMIYRATPIEATGVSPAELMVGRPIRTTMPSLPRNMVPTAVTHDDVRQRDARYKERTADRYNKGARPLPPLNPGDQVRVRDEVEKTWSEPLTVAGEANGPRSYIIERQEGQRYRRNRRQLQRVPKADTDTLSPGIDNEAGRQVLESPDIETPAIGSKPQSITRYGRKVMAPTRLIENM